MHVWLLEKESGLKVDVILQELKEKYRKTKVSIWQKVYNNSPQPAQQASQIVK